MQSGGGDKRVKPKLVLREEAAELDDDTFTFDADMAGDQDDEIGQLRDRHEALRRKVALLNAQLDDARKPLTSTDLTMPAWPLSVGMTAVIAVATLTVGLLAAWARKNAE
jgi:hypothetical protein